MPHSSSVQRLHSWLVDCLLCIALLGLEPKQQGYDSGHRAPSSHRWLPTWQIIKWPQDPLLSKHCMLALPFRADPGSCRLSQPPCPSYLPPLLASTNSTLLSGLGHLIVIGPDKHSG